MDSYPTTDALYTINLVTGDATPINSIAGDKNLLGLEFISDPVAVRTCSWGSVKTFYR